MDKYHFTIHLTTYGVLPSVYPRGADTAIGSESERINSKRNSPGASETSVFNITGA